MGRHKRDPRVNPRKGDMLNDDDPLPPLEVVKVGGPLAARVVECERLHEDGSKWVGRWPLKDWRVEMEDAVVMGVA